MYKVVFRVIKVSEPQSLDSDECHVSGPCQIYEVGDRITVATDPGRIVLEETDSVCLAAFGSVLPMTSALCRDTTEVWDYMDKIKYFCCPDIERPVIFKIERIEVTPEEMEQEKRRRTPI